MTLFSVMMPTPSASLGLAYGTSKCDEVKCEDLSTLGHTTLSFPRPLSEGGIAVVMKGDPTARNESH